jgi:HSP20 family molecular chaperone IbpA
MAPRAIHLKRGLQDIYITVDSLFEAAFGPTPRDYLHKSLLGWRPMAAHGLAMPPQAKNRPGRNAERALVQAPGVKLFETEALIVVEIELPPIEEQSLYLEISGDMLIIRGNRASAATPNPPHRRKRAARKVYRYVQLPVVARPGEVRARLDGHVVRVMIRKTDALEHTK